MYRPLPNELTIKSSKIEGLGLFATIKIKKNSVIGAGTVVDKNVQEGSVVYRKSKLIKKEKK